MPLYTTFYASFHMKHSPTLGIHVTYETFYVDFQKTKPFCPYMALLRAPKDKRQSFLTSVKACLLNTIPRVIPSYPQNLDSETLPLKDLLTAPHQTIYKHKGRP